jgi:hypothetical protein
MKSTLRAVIIDSNQSIKRRQKFVALLLHQSDNGQPKKMHRLMDVLASSPHTISSFVELYSLRVYIAVSALDVPAACRAASRVQTWIIRSPAEAADPGTNVSSNMADLLWTYTPPSSQVYSGRSGFVTMARTEGQTGDRRACHNIACCAAVIELCGGNMWHAVRKGLDMAMIAAVATLIELEAIWHHETTHRL